MTNACGIQDPQGTIVLGTPFLWIERMVGRAAQCPIRLRSKRGAGKAMSKGGMGELRRSIRCRWGELTESFAFYRLHRLVCANRLSSMGRSKFGCTQFRWGERLPQLQTEIPYPLGKDLGKLLTAW